MLLAACDFDGTLYRDGGISLKDCQAVARWREQGNIFGIVTGRGAPMLFQELRRVPMTCDFLICNNGALLLDGQGHPLSCLPLDLRERLDVLRHQALRDATRCAVFESSNMFLLEGSGGFWGKKKYQFPELSCQEASRRCLQQISMAFENRTISLAWGQKLAEEFAGRIGIHCSLFMLDITAPSAGKASGIRQAIALNKWHPEQVLTCGDDINDKEMLTAFRGVVMAGADEGLRSELGLGSVASVEEMLLGHLSCEAS